MRLAICAFAVALILDFQIGSAAAQGGPPPPPPPPSSTLPTSSSLFLESLGHMTQQVSHVGMTSVQQ